MSLDRQRLDALVAYFGPAETASMIVKALAGLDGHMQDLRHANDPSAASKLGHKLKGLAAMYGLDAVATAAHAIEQDVAAPRLAAMVADLDCVLTEAKGELSAFARNLMPDV
jgi:HPt (histidine-containing phosphotransfer) domain-containing protein